MPVYIVEVTGTDTKKLVDAPNQASARGHVARQVITTKVATGAELFAIAKAGGDIETVGAEEPVPWTEETTSPATAADGTERKVGEPRRPAKVD